VFASAERKVELDTAFELRTAEQVAAALGEMKGALMKLGQMASYLDQGLPEHVRGALAQLQSDAPPMSAELAAGVIRSELGHDPDVVFATWDPVPIASASIGQVHRAMTHDGEAVAVKVQYPGVAEAMASDLANIGLLFGGLGQLFPGFEPGPVVAELRERLTEELDYANEAANQIRFGEEYASCPPPGCSPPNSPTGSGSTRSPPPGRNTNATSQRRRSTASPSDRCTGCACSTATRTPATTCSGPEVKSRSLISVSSNTSPKPNCCRSKR
jgi:hypothetical protein